MKIAVPAAAVRPGPKFSIITVSYNSRATMQQAMDSVWGQTYTDYEYIVVDGASTDGTAELVAASSAAFAYCCSEPDLGIYDAMNKALRQARGEYVFFLGADDCLAQRDVLERIAAALQDPVDILCGRVWAVDEGYSGLQRPMGSELAKADILAGEMPPHQGMFVRRELLVERPFDTAYRWAADFAFFLQAIRDGASVRFIPDFVAFYSIGGQSSAHARACYAEYQQILVACGVEVASVQQFKRKKLRWLSLKGLAKNLLAAVGGQKISQRRRGYAAHHCAWPGCRWCAAGAPPPSPKPRLVISGVNMVSGGILSILRDSTAALAPLTAKYDIILLVHRRQLIEDLAAGFTVYEYPLAKKSWFLRCFYEYVYFYFFSRKVKPYLWLSLHDMTPWVRAERQAVYCHNPAPFYRLKPREYLLDKKFTLFTWFYRYLYGFRIKKNTAVIVQQQWLQQAFAAMYGIKNGMVARPEIPAAKIPGGKAEKNLLLYPAFPRVFKNMELLGETMALLADTKLHLVLTIDGTENAYAKQIVDAYGFVEGLSFAGCLPRSEVFAYYGRAAALVFPSKLETWGLPLTEFATTGKPIFAADLPYARETLAGYPQAYFFDPGSPAALADLLREFAAGTLKKKAAESRGFDDNGVLHGWDALFQFLLR